jgi:misacylated tRNA(Ala) deacylase
MTELLFLDDSYLRSMQAHVLEVRDERFVIVDRTVFYPQGGGQPGDSGAIFRNNEKFTVINTTKKEGVLMHEVDRAGISAGDSIRGEIDWERRYTHMRYHTAAHILCAVFHNQGGALITGNQISSDKLRIDFSLDDYDPLRMQHYVAEANRLAALDAPVSVRTMAREEALQLPGIVKLAGALPPNIPQLRILTIGDERTGIIDEQADGGTHVHSTKEIGNIVFSASENKGKNNRRVTVVLQ